MSKKTKKVYLVARSLILLFSTLQTESGLDVLTIYDGSNIHATKIAGLSGDIESVNISSTGNHLLLKWTTDGSIVKSGYFAYAYYRIPNVATGPIYDNCCTFPFVYENVEYNHCINNDQSTYWCATQTNSNGTYSKWKNCDENCSKVLIIRQDFNIFE